LRVIDVVGQILLSVLGMVFLGGATLGVLASAVVIQQETAPDSIFPAFVGGTIMMTVFWVLGIVLAGKVCDTSDKDLFLLTPLTPSRYLCRNLTRVFPALIVLFGAFPVLVGWLLWVFDATNRFAALPFPLYVSIVLTLLLAFLVPLNEGLTGGRWSNGFFFLRVIVVALLRLVVLLFDAAGKVLGRAAILLAPVAAFAVYRAFPWTTDLLMSGLDSLVEAGPVGVLVYYLLVPVGGIIHLCMSDSSESVQWAVAALLLFVTVGCLISIARHWNTLPREIDEHMYDFWTDWREEIEELERDEQKKRQRWRQEFCNVYDDGILERENEAAPLNGKERRLAYKRHLPPERQLCRHDLFWSPVPVYVSLWLVLALVAWGVCFGIEMLVRNDLGNHLTSKGVLMMALFACTWFSALVSTENAKSDISAIPPIPLRWPGWIWTAFLHTRNGVLLADALVAGLYVYIGRLSILWLPVFLFAFLLLRISTRAGIFCSIVNETGHTFTALFYAIGMALSLLGSFFGGALYLVTGVTSIYEPNPTVLAPLCFAMLAPVVIAFLGAAMTLALEFRRGRTQVMVVPPRNWFWSIEGQDTD
jgi:hypothetical protein